MADQRTQIIISAKDETKQAFDAVRSSLGSVNGLLAGFGVGLSAVGLASLVKDTADFNDEIGDLAQQLGTTTERLSALKFAADIEGVFGELQVAMQRVAKASEEAADGSKSAQEAFAKLKIDPTQFKDTGALFEAIAEELSKLPDGAQKTGIAMDLLGKSGAKLIPLINGGADGLARAREEAEKFGLIVSEEAAEAAGKFNDNLARLQAASKGVTVEIGNQMLPALTEISEAMVLAAKEGGILTAIWVGLGGVAANVLGLDQMSQSKDRIAEIGREVSKIKGELAGGLKSTTQDGLIPYTAEEIQVRINKLKDLGLELASLQNTASAPPKTSSSGGGVPNTPTSTGKSDAERAAESAAKAAQAFTDNLVKQAATLNLTKTEIQAYEAAQLNLTKTQQAAVDASIALIEANERNNDALKDATEFEKLLQESEQRALELQDESAQAEADTLATRDAAYEDFYAKLIEQNEQLNIDLIADDKKRAKAQLDIENERAIERIQALILEQEQIDELLKLQADAYDKQSKKIEQSTSSVANLSKELGRQFTSAFEDAVLSGEDFGDTLDGLGKDLERLALQSLTNPFFKGIQSLFEEGISNFIPGLTANAKGGTYSSPALSSYSNSVVTQPTVFPFAKGIGLMGEKIGSPGEAIMPLSRTSDGDLGVKVQGSGGSVTVNIYGAPSTPEVSQTTDDNGNTNIDVMFEKVESYLGQRVAKGQGALAEVLGGSYGLSRGYGAQG